MGLFDRAGLPRGDFLSLGEALAGRARVLAWARGDQGPVVALVDRLALRSSDGWRFVAWHEIAKGGWQAESGRLRWTLVTGERDEVTLAQPGSLPEVFRDRVGASIVVHERLELERGRAAMIVARRRLDDDAPLIWSLTPQGGPFDSLQADRAYAEMARLRAEYDIT